MDDIKLLKEAHENLKAAAEVLETEKTARSEAEERAEKAEAKIAAYEAASQLVRDRVIDPEQLLEYVEKFEEDPTAIKAAEALVELGAPYSGSLGRTVSAPEAHQPGSAHDVLDRELAKIEFSTEAIPD